MFDSSVAVSAIKPAPTVVFIGGVGRSGTTMLGSMLGTHPEHLCVPETTFKSKLLRLYRGANSSEVPIADVIRVLRKEWKFKQFDIEDHISRQAPGRLGYRQLMEEIVLLYGNRVGKPNPRVWIDHTPSNLRYAAELHNHHPGAYFVHIVRDGRGVAASVLPLDWGPNTIANAAKFWVEGLAYGLAAEAWLPGQVVRVRYEDLVAEPNATLARLCLRLGIAYVDEMVTGTGFLIPRSHSATHALVGTRPSPGRIESWKKTLSNREIEIFESTAGPMLHYLGYETLYGNRARPISRGELWLQEITGWAKKLLIDNARRYHRRRLLVDSHLQ